jgi:hypothetical protein
MAFDAAASGDRSARSRAASSAVAVGDGDVNTLGQRIWTLNSTLKSIEGLTAQLGSPGDTTLLRAKLGREEATAAALITELDAGIRKLRVAQLASPGRDAAAARPVERVNEQYADIRRRVVETARLSQQRQRQFVPAESPAAAVAAAALNDSRRGGGGTQRALRASGPGEPGGGDGPIFQPLSEPQQSVMLEMTRISDVDEALAQVRGTRAPRRGCAG